ncbi:MAG TPA: helix-turn-helix domain-containing protein [Roseibacillus sp.]|jgi:excisionase family DNA binding protein|nr:helix-turn-helix domain-containing protein [Roseibacillus sp.]|tara:strand:- start:41 stop:262 length:222 start_codon:yes stop_codon:yes gene_type:complete
MDENHDTPAQVAPSPRSELELVTEEELSSLLKICKRQLYNWRMRGEIPYFKLGRSVRFRVEDVMEALERLRVE